MSSIMTRMGDGFPVEMSESELRRDLEAGTEDAADRGMIDPLSREELGYLYDLFKSPHRFVGVEPGSEIVLSYDGGPIKFTRAAIDVHRIQAMQIHEKVMGQGPRRFQSLQLNGNGLRLKAANNNWYSSVPTLFSKHEGICTGLCLAVGNS